MSFVYECDRGASKWGFLLTVCEKRDTALEEIIFPKRHTGDISCKRRRSVLSELWDNGWDIHDLMTVCPLSERAIRRAVNEP
jgi:hypothetical protein